MPATSPLPQWVEQYREPAEAMKASRAARAASRGVALSAAVLAAEARAAELHARLKELDGRDCGGGAVVRVAGPSKSIGDGRSVVVTVGGLPVVRVQCGFRDNGGQMVYTDADDHRRYFLPSDDVTFGREWIDSQGVHWPANHRAAGMYSERTLAEYLMEILT